MSEWLLQHEVELLRRAYDCIERLAIIAECEPEELMREIEKRTKGKDDE